MKKRLAWHAAVAVSLVGALALAGCGGDDDNDDAGTGSPDSSTPDSGDPDGGMNDADTGVVVDPCPDNTEGCECISDAPNSQMIQQDTCEAGLTCVPWDLLSPRGAEFTGRFQSCVRTCETDADCGAGRFCTSNSLFTEQSGLDRICVDQTVGVDNWCGFSKLLNPQHPTLTIETGSQMVGCANGHDCQMNFFNDVHPAEGICFDTCQDSTDCAMFTDTSTCNPRLFTTGSTVTPFIGVCSSGDRQPGDLCGSGPNAEFSFTSACDTSNSPTNETACLGAGVNSLLGAGVGYCWSVCADPNEPATVCPPDPGLGNQACIPNLLNNGAGLCDVGCDNFADPCSGDDGTNGLGRVCQTLQAAGTPPTLFSQCTNRLGPPLSPGIIGVDGRLIDEGDPCDNNNPQLGTTDILRCPEPTLCAPLAAEGICLVGCETSTAAELTCPEITGVATSTCVVPNPPGGDSPIGFCAGL